MERRQFIGVVGTGTAITLAGCGSSGDGGSDEEDSDQSNNDGLTGDGGDSQTTDGSDEPTETTETLVDDRRNVQEDEYYRYSFSAEREAQYDARMTVRDGPNVDFIVTSQEEFEAYQNDERFRYNEALSMLDSTGDTTSARLPAGDLVIIIDNTNRGPAEPPANSVNDVAEVELTVTGTHES